MFFNDFLVFILILFIFCNFFLYFLFCSRKGKLTSKHIYLNKLFTSITKCLVNILTILSTYLKILPIVFLQFWVYSLLTYRSKIMQITFISHENYYVFIVSVVLTQIYPFFNILNAFLIWILAWCTCKVDYYKSNHSIFQITGDKRTKPLLSSSIPKL